MSLQENFTTDAYMRILVDLSNCAAGTSTSVSPSEALSLIPEVARQAALANARLEQSLTAAYVGNIVALRDVVISKFVVPVRTLEMLRGGDFSTDMLFGPLPEHFANLLDASHGSLYRCKSKYAGAAYAPQTPRSTSTPSLAGKRPGSSRGLPRAKRTHAPVTQAPRGRGLPFHRRSASRRSRFGRS